MEGEGELKKGLGGGGRDDSTIAQYYYFSLQTKLFFFSSLQMVAGRLHVNLVQRRDPGNEVGYMYLL